MADIRALKRRINSVKSIQQVTRAMKMVAAAKLKRAQVMMEQARPYAFRINGVLKALLPNINRDMHPLLAIREPVNIAYVIITADRGLCGSFNTNIIRAAEREFATMDKSSLKLICIGKKGRDHFAKRGYNIIGEYVDFFKNLQFAHAQKVVELITNLYIREELDAVKIIFNEFKNVMQQRIVLQKFLPLELDEGEEVEVSDMLYEPSQKEIVYSLIPRHLNVQMWRNLLESNAAEQGARMTAMENATENADEMIKDLTLVYNKARQAGITKEMLEIVTGAEAMKS